MIRRFAKWLRTSSHVHLRTKEISSYAELVALIDRFLEDRLLYSLEWDDFVSWNHSDNLIEVVRTRIAELEPLFISGVPSEIDRAVEILVIERNRVAAVCGIDERSVPPG